MKKAEEEESDDETSSSSSTDGSSSSSEIGLKPGQKAQKPKAKAKRRPKAKSSPPQTVTESEVVTTDSAVPSEAGSKSEKGPEKAEKVLEKSNQILSSLKELSSLSMWMGSVKAKDISSRVSKGVDLASKCEGFPGEPSIAEIFPQLNEEVNRVSQQQEMFMKLATGKDVGQVLTQYKQDLFTIVLGWKNEDIASFLSDIGLKMCFVKTSNGIGLVLRLPDRQ